MTRNIFMNEILTQEEREAIFLFQTLSQQEREELLEFLRALTEGRRIYSK